MPRFLPQALQHVAGAARQLGNLLGPWLGALFPALLHEGFDLQAALLPALVHALAAGPRGDAAPAGKAALLGGFLKEPQLCAPSWPPGQSLHWLASAGDARDR